MNPAWVTANKHYAAKTWCCYYCVITVPICINSTVCLLLLTLLSYYMIRHLKMSESLMDVFTRAVWARFAISVCWIFTGPPNGPTGSDIKQQQNNSCQRLVLAYRRQHKLVIICRCYKLRATEGIFLLHRWASRRGRFLFSVLFLYLSSPGWSETSIGNKNICLWSYKALSITIRSFYHI